MASNCSRALSQSTLSTTSSILWIMKYPRAKVATCPFQQCISTVEWLTPEVPGKWVSKEPGQPLSHASACWPWGSPWQEWGWPAGGKHLCLSSRHPRTLCGLLWGFLPPEAETRGWGAGSDLSALSSLPRTGSERRWSHFFLQGAHCYVQGQSERLNRRTFHSKDC